MSAERVHKAIVLLFSVICVTMLIVDLGIL